MLVTALRSFLEEQGTDFSAQLSGKLKMVLQCVAAGWCLLFVHLASGGEELAAWMSWLRDGFLWTAVAVTVVSGLGYVWTAIALLKQQHGGEGTGEA
jgi:CDP-diacylglycerol--glycerol-3-phosphate 3-phosphatidyltransferase